LTAATIAAVVEIAQKLMASFAFLVGGGWVLMNYFRNRTHVARLQVEVETKIVEGDDRRYLLANCQAKNVGLSIFWLRKPKNKGEEEREKGLPGTALSVRMLPQFAPESVIIEAPWETEVVSFEVFLSHDRIEPGLTISEQKLISLPSLDYDAIWVELKSRLIAKNGAPSRSPYLRKTARKLV
jgi:hypothetical protein